MKKTEWTMETLDNRSAFMRNIASNTTIKHKNSITEEVLDEIRAEIMAIGNWTTKSELPNEYLVKVLEIIDKYKAESEDKE